MPNADVSAPWPGPIGRFNLPVVRPFEKQDKLVDTIEKFDNLLCRRLEPNCPLNLEHIRTFLEIAACGSFNRAAEILNVTQSTVSARIKALEESFGRPLFTRGHAGAQLTAAGHNLQHYALRMQRLWQQAHQELSLPAGFRTALGLGAQVSLWERLILDWIPWMREKAPDVALRVEADYSASQMRQLSDGLLDIGVMYQPRQTPGLIVEKLLEETLVLVSTQKRDTLYGWVEDYVLVDWGDVFRTFHGEAFPDLETPAVSVGLGALGLQYILQNGGSGYFPLRVVRPLIEQARLYQLPNAPVARRPVYVVYTANPTDKELLDLALHGLRHIAAGEIED
jgi:DNA-binding transcriptional LysR family regulator